MVQTEKALREYQERSVNITIGKFAQGIRRVIFQMATGGGKSPCFASMTHRYISKKQDRVLILVHREELLLQARKTLFNWFDISAVPVVAETNYLPNCRVMVAMVETAFNRLKRNPRYFGNVGLLIIDEVHRGEFKKLYPHFPDSLICGFSATPISGKKDDPLSNYFDDIVCSIDIPELIEIWKEDHTQGLVPNKTICMSTINRTALKVRGGEFADREMAEEYSKVKHVNNCLHAYKTYADGLKTIIYNVSIEHNEKVYEVFSQAGYPVRKVDGGTEAYARRNIFKWFKETPGAVLCNVDIATTGNDEPSIEAVICNFSTQSLTKWLQTTGRGGRPFHGKEQFLILDLGGNGVDHGDWSDPRPWKDIFFYPERSRKSSSGDAPSKQCKECNALIPAGAHVCKYCGADNKKQSAYDTDEVSFGEYKGKLLPAVDVEDIIQVNINYKPLAALHKIKNAIISHVKYKWRIRRGKMTDEVAEQILAHYNKLVYEWLEIGKEKFGRWPDKTGDAWIRNGAWHQRLAREWMTQELEKQFEWKPKS
jgi:superfamily II DNA or RNA helicase